MLAYVDSCLKSQVQHVGASRDYVRGRLSLPRRAKLAAPPKRNESSNLPPRRRISLLSAQLHNRRQASFELQLPLLTAIPTRAVAMGDPRESSSYKVTPRIRYNTIGGVNGPLVILENVGAIAGQQELCDGC